MGHLRDALSRNELKLPDLDGEAEFVGGDPLLRANQQLAERAPGVYQRGEVYLRGLQRASSLAFGTRLGRWLTLFVALPFGGGYATVVFVQEILHLVRLPHHLDHAELATAIGSLGVFYLLLLHWPAARALAVHALGRTAAAARAVALELPVAFLQLPAVRQVLDSRTYLFLSRYVLKPLPVALLAVASLWAGGVASGPAVLVGALVLALTSLVINSRLGRDLEETLADWTARRVDYVRDLVPGIFRLVMDVFKRGLELVDRLLYAVDEWLRFRSGEGRLTWTVKIVLGLLWSIVSYGIRLFVNVFIEPTINPLKHFPAVTVAAKLLVPFWIPLTKLFGMPLLFLGEPLAYGIAFLGIHALPGAAGFLVWELKENWRLYRANRAPTLRPVIVGSHGETLLRLLKPGFHSGTLPKLYARLRRAERRAARHYTWRSPRQLREALHHVEESIVRLVERELLAFLPERSAAWQRKALSVARVETSSNQVRIAIACPALEEPDLELRFEEQSGWLLARVAQPGWLPQLSAEQRLMFTTALAGFYHKCGVDLVREQIAASFAPACPPYDIADNGLVVWPGKAYETEVMYNLNAGPYLRPQVIEGTPPSDLPTLAADRLLFGRRPLRWEDWVAAWNRIGEGGGDAGLLNGQSLL